MTNEFERFASLDRGISPMTLGRYNAAVDRYINPTIIEERKMNVASMDVFSRLLMDRIIFLAYPSTTMSQTSSRPSCSSWRRWTARRTSPST